MYAVTVPKNVIENFLSLNKLNDNKQMHQKYTDFNIQIIAIWFM